MGKVIQFPNRLSTLEQVFDSRLKEQLKLDSKFADRPEHEKLLMSRLGGFTMADRDADTYYFVRLVPVAINGTPTVLLYLDTDLVITNTQFREVLESTTQEIEMLLGSGESSENLEFAIPYVTEEELLYLASNLTYLAISDTNSEICNKVMQASNSLTIVQLVV